MYICFSYTLNAHRTVRGLQIFPLRVYCSQRICKIGAVSPRRCSMKNLILIVLFLLLRTFPDRTEKRGSSPEK